jgi:hypothetical protein
MIATTSFLVVGERVKESEYLLRRVRVCNEIPFFVVILKIFT